MIRRFRKLSLFRRVLLAVVIVLLLCLAYVALFPGGQRPDYYFDTTIRNPSYTSSHPILTFDEGHNNAHPVSGGYAPFANLMRADGYAIKVHTGSFTADTLRGTAVLVIVNADGATNPKLFGFNLEPLRKGVRGSPAFTDDEVRAIQEWVAAGGSLLLVADHAPFGTAASGLAAAFSVKMHGGFAEVPNQYQGQPNPSIIEFTTENGLLAEHPIMQGRSADERVRRVRSFTGQSLDGPPGSSLLRLPRSAIETHPVPADRVGSEPAQSPAGAAQGVAFEYGRGRVVVLGEAAMITAQIDQRGQKFGMNQPGIDNRQFTLNALHWLSRLLK
jgi:hypothetical protein